MWGVWHAEESRFAFSSSPRARKVRNLAANPRAVVMADSTVECVSVEGRAGPVRDGKRLEQWIDRILAKYRPMAPDMTADFLRRHLMVEFEPERAFSIIETEEEFSTRATRWVFGS